MDLRYVARAGLLPELSRQTYDSLWKATREAVLNSVDASASSIELDLSRVISEGVLEVLDDGTGMSLSDFCDRFMSLGGSSRYGDETRFGRVGIGSLALLQYGRAAVIESKVPGAPTFMRARIAHPWDLEREQRYKTLGELPAGAAEELNYEGERSDHFTRVRLEGVNEHVVAVASDPSRFYAYCDRLQRVLPLPLGTSRLLESLRKINPTLLRLLEAHVASWSAPVVVHSPWQRDIELLRRTYGEDASRTEEWSGPPKPLHKTITARDDAGRRRITVAGYLLIQKRASVAWSGIIARVQNVAVEDQTFFEVSSDPGFRKYITGEVWILGEVSRERLINMDRSSFNREAADYKAIRRYMGDCVVEFKKTRVQRVQRAKVVVKKRLDDHVETVAAVRRVVASLPVRDGRELPSSDAHRRIRANAAAVVQDLIGLGAEVCVDAEDGTLRRPYVLDATEDGRGVRVCISADLVDPAARYGHVEYAIQIVRSGRDAPPVVVRQRPRRIILNLDHPSHERGGVAKVQASVAMEFAYLFGAERGAEGVYEQMLAILRDI